ncbi:F-box/kelch-repeat protein [Camellia lanceoleosa]|uniref:F-box/kelch-repeat protein n=1 Tax=Camellia lanceoleosa TaxID=1840588 RepID=A0ACC0I610_9ERIC|nr:F-box/kelch-repeat protein [Camellia lanceoleosa]
MTREVVENATTVNGGEKNENTWSNLPTLIVWMIKDRLDFPTNRRFAVVCKSWHEASLSYTINHQSTTREPPPWIMMTREVGESQRDFINISTGEKYTIDLPDFRKTIVLYSTKGWLLLVKVTTHTERNFLERYVDTDTDCPFFLLNPFTKAKIKLPLIPHIPEPYGAFTVVDANPQIVVLASAAFFNRRALPCINLWTIHVGVDQVWSQNSSTWQLPRTISMIPSVLIVGQVVYCFNRHSQVFVFDLLNSQFQDPMKTETAEFSKPQFCVLENRGEIYKVCHRLDYKNFKVATMFYRLKTNSDWEHLNSEDLRDKHWYLISRPEYQCFVLKKKGPCEIYRNQMVDVDYNEYFKMHFFAAHERVRKFPSELNTIVRFRLMKDCRLITDWVDMG